MPEQIQIPRVLWAQQRETVLLTISVPDIEKVDVKFEENLVTFNGQTSSTNPKDKNVYAVTIDLYEKIDPEACKYENIGQKYWRLLLKKKDSAGPFWPRLTKEKVRLNWLQTDFDHWKDEDESDDEKAGAGPGAGFDGNFQNMFSGGKRNY
jgi:prostaglandin-E synthase